MSSTPVYTVRRPIHPVHAAALGGVLPLFLCALLSDYAFYTTYEIQWANFASWLLVAAMVMTTLALIAALIGQARRSRRLPYTLILGAIWVVGFINNLQHARDNFAVMPAGLWLSVLLTLLALVATVIGFASLRTAGDIR